MLISCSCLAAEIAWRFCSVLSSQVCPYRLLQPWLVRVTPPTSTRRGSVCLPGGLVLLRRPPLVEVVDLEQAWTCLSLLCSGRLHVGLCPAQRAWRLVSDLLAARSPASSNPTGPSQHGPQLLICWRWTLCRSGRLRAGSRLSVVRALGCLSGACFWPLTAQV